MDGARAGATRRVPVAVRLAPEDTSLVGRTETVAALVDGGHFHLGRVGWYMFSSLDTCHDTCQVDELVADGVIARASVRGELQEVRNHICNLLCNPICDHIARGQRAWRAAGGETFCGRGYACVRL